MSTKKILSLCYPRNDILTSNDQSLIKKLKYLYEIPSDIDKVYLYAPTFRSDFTLRFPIKKNELNELNNHLMNSKSLFLIKAHLFEQRIHFEDLKNIRLVNKSTDIYELLLITDVLISDYSSIIFNFLHTLKPILLYTYDLDDYVKQRGLYHDFNTIAPGPLLFNAKDLIKSIKNIDYINIKYLEKRKIINNRFNNYKNRKPIERILDFFNIQY